MEESGESRQSRWVAREGEYEKLERADMERQERERAERIRESRYNKWYREIRVEGVQKYLKEEWKEERRLGNEMREGRYWEEQKNRMCRICGWEDKTWQHVMERYSGKQREEKEIGERIGELLDE